MRGAVTGLGRGVVGALAKPMGGLLDFVATTVQVRQWPSTYCRLSTGANHLSPHATWNRALQGVLTGVGWDEDDARLGAAATAVSAPNVLWPPNEPSLRRLQALGAVPASACMNDVVVVGGLKYVARRGCALAGTG